jgi:hypothetical protein
MISEAAGDGLEVLHESAGLEAVPGVVGRGADAL